MYMLDLILTLRLKKYLRKQGYYSEKECPENGT